MGASNFYYDNILVALPDFNVYDDDGEFVFFDNCSFEEHVSIVQDNMVNAFKKAKNIDVVPIDGDYDKDARSYPGRVYCRIDIYSNARELYESIDVIVRSGYYDGMNIDYRINGSDEYYLFENRSTKTLDKKVENVIKKLESVLIKSGKHLRRVGGFSDGTSVYEEIKK